MFLPVDKENITRGSSMGIAYRRSGATPAPLDPRSLANIRALEAKSAPHLLARLIDIFLEDTPNIIHDLCIAVSTGDAGQIKHLAHRLKGSCANFGASALVARCEELEGLSATGSLRGVAESLRRVEDEYGRVRVALEQIRRATTAP
jgi:HPt (histidine-containing phosphotransfer) domain-containing protein